MTAKHVLLQVKPLNRIMICRYFLSSRQEPHKGQTISQSKYIRGQLWLSREETHNPWADWEKQGLQSQFSGQAKALEDLHWKSSDNYDPSGHGRGFICIRLWGFSVPRICDGVLRGCIVAEGAVNY